MLTPAGLVVALVLSAPALYDVTNGSLGLGAALLRLLAALALVAVATAILRRVMAPQAPLPGHPGDDAPADRRNAPHPGRRRDDA